MLISLEHIVKKYALNIKGVLHVGAHYGQEYKDYKNLGIKNMIFFEPMRMAYKKLLAETMLSGAQTYNIALGNEIGEREMFVETANGGQSCSFLEPGTHLKKYPKIIFDTKEVVKIDKLDNIEFDRQKFNMINIDVQGFELEVFKGAEETLPFIDIICSEVNFEDVYKGCVHVEDLDKFLGKFGFVRVLTNFRPVTWGDALYLKYE